MSSQEKTMCAKIAQLPPELQQQFLDKIDGAAMALEILAKDKEQPHDDSRA